MTVLFADHEHRVDPAELLSCRELGCSVYSLTPERFLEQAPFFPQLLRNSWLIYQWLKPRAFDCVFFQDDSSAGLISIAAKRLGEAFATTRLIYCLHGPESWITRLRDRGRLRRDDLTLSYSVQYGVENADQLIVPAQYFLDRIGVAGWKAPDRVSVLPYLSMATSAVCASAPAPAGLRVIYPVHDSDHAPLSIFLKAVAALERAGKDVQLAFICYGDTKEQRHAARRVRRVMTAAGVSGSACEMLDGAAGQLPGDLGGLWMFSALWLNLPFLILRAANCGVPILLAASSESESLVNEPDCQVNWMPDDLVKKLSQCLNGKMAPSAGQAPAAIEKAWEVELFNTEQEPIRAQNYKVTRVSVCVAHFNKARDLHEALHSLRAQTHPDLEVIVVDDASTEPDARAGFEAAASTFASPDWKFIKEEVNRGPGNARNRAVTVATGSHVIFFDADDVAFPDMVERLLQALMRSKGACVAGSSRRLKDSDGPSKAEGTSTYVGGSLETAFIHPPAGSVFIIARDLFNEVGGFKTDLPQDCHEDWNFHMRLLARELRLHVLPEPVFAYRSVPLSRSLLVPHDMGLLLEPLRNCTPRVQLKLIELAIENAGALESAERALASYEQFEKGFRLLRFLKRLKLGLQRPFRSRQKQ